MDVETNVNDEVDELEEDITAFLNVGCGCLGGKSGNPCSKSFSKEAVVFNLHNCLELSREELDLVILANIQSSTHEHTHQVSDKRSRSPRCCFMYRSTPICKTMFLKLYGISDARFRSLKEHYEIYGIYPRTHGNTKRMPSNTLTYATVEDIKTYISNYVEENGVLLPGRVPGYKNDDIKLLPSCETKKSVWKCYSKSCDEAGKNSVSYSKFLELWNNMFPDVIVAKPMTDLCAECQENTTKLQRAANLSEEEKSNCVKLHQEHLDRAKAERECYRKACKEAEENLASLGEEFDYTKAHDSCSSETTMHYSFDYAQQVHIPSNPMQPGPIYFKTPRKCGIFGVTSEAIPRQVNFLIDEAVSVGKGANPTISYFHYFPEHHGLGETNGHFHADNCGAQNKNNFFLWYFAWRGINKLHVTILYSFLLAGYTKFGPDRGFGLLKKAVRATYVSSLYELGSVVETSSPTGVNKAQLVGTHDGKVIVPVYDWSAFLGQYFRKVPNITKFHHFRFDVSEPGIVYYREFVSSEEQKFNLLKQQTILPPSNPPPIVRPNGLDAERQSYLHKEIRRFCKPGTEDLVAPSPKI